MFSGLIHINQHIYIYICFLYTIANFTPHGAAGALSALSTLYSLLLWRRLKCAQLSIPSDKYQVLSTEQFDYAS